jgi:hypothetical protein
MLGQVLDDGQIQQAHILDPCTPSLNFYLTLHTFFTCWATSACSRSLGSSLITDPTASLRGPSSGDIARSAVAIGESGPLGTSERSC